MTIELVFETHATSEDNEAGIATGWNPGRLSRAGRQQARELGERRRADGIAVIFSSDLARAVETASIAFDGLGVDVRHDWRLRECNYGARNGSPTIEHHPTRVRHIDEPYPGGESWRQAVTRVGWFLGDLRRGGTERRVLVIGHSATKWALDHWLLNLPLEALVGDRFDWQPGWEYRL